MLVSTQKIRYSDVLFKIKSIPNYTMSEAEVIKLIYNLVAHQGYSTIKLQTTLMSLPFYLLILRITSR